MTNIEICLGLERGIHAIMNSLSRIKYCEEIRGRYHHSSQATLKLITKSPNKQKNQKCLSLVWLIWYNNLKWY